MKTTEGANQNQTKVLLSVTLPAVKMGESYGEEETSIKRLTVFTNGLVEYYADIDEIVGESTHRTYVRILFQISSLESLGLRNFDMNGDNMGEEHLLMVIGISNTIVPVYIDSGKEADFSILIKGLMEYKVNGVFTERFLELIQTLFVVKVGGVK
jgi:hypothetical protein